MESTIDRVLRILSVGDLIYEEYVLVMTLAVSVEYAQEYLRGHGMLNPELEKKIALLKDALGELARESTPDYKSALMQMRRAHKLHSEFLSLGNRLD
jgi:hypothetical protein